MIHNTPARRLLAGFLLFLFTFSSHLQARPLLRNPFLQDEEKKVKKLPPVNWIRSRSIDTKHIAIDLRFDWEKEQAYGTATITLAPLADLDSFPLDAAQMEIGSVMLIGGGPLQFDYDEKKDNDNLRIMLGKVHPAGVDLSVKIGYKTKYVNKADAETAIGSFGRGLRFIKPSADNPNKPRQIWSQGETEFNRYWFPSYDSPNDFRTTELRATVEKPFTVVSNGKLIETKNNPDNTRTFYWKMDTPYTNYLTSIVVGEYREVVQNFERIPVVNYGYTTESKEVAATVKNLPATIKFFSEITGIKYPYPKYSQAFVEDFGGGMENISATTQIEEMIHDERELLDEDSESLQSHELAHQWFGDYVTCRDWGQIWLNESFATYMQAMWHERLKGHDYFLYNDVRGNQQQYYDTWNGGNRHPIVTKYYANKDAMFDNYAYPRGAAVLHMLRKHLGDKAFFKSLNHYLVSNAHQPVSTEDLRIAIEETTGQSMDWFFDQWLYRMGHPIFEVTQRYNGDTKKLILTVKQTQKIDILDEYPQVEFFQTYVDVAIDGRVHRVWIEPKAENVFTFDSAALPKIVNFDHEGTLIKELIFEKSTDDLIYQLASDKDVLGRYWAIGGLVKKAEGSSDSPRILHALLAAAEKDPLAENRRAALDAVKEMLTPPTPPGEYPVPLKLDAVTTGVLLKAVKDANSLIRADAIEFLGATRDPKFSDVYAAALNDRSYTVIEQASVALGDTGHEGAYAALVKLTGTPSWRDRIQVAGLNGLVWLGDKRALDLAMRMATDKSEPEGTRNAALGVVGATGKGDPRAYPLVIERFRKALDTNNRAQLFTCVQAILDLADPRGQEAFDALKVKYKDQAEMLVYIALFEDRFKKAIEIK
jgi:aminopeptidase N